MARTILARFSSADAAEGAVRELLESGVPRGDIELARGGTALEVTTEAVLGSAVYEIVRRHGAAETDIERRTENLLGWERYEPSADPALQERERGLTEEWEESSRVGTTAGAVTGAATGAALGAVAGPLGAVVGGIAGAVVGGATGAAGDVAGKTAEDALDDDDDISGGATPAATV
jgi:hypothetical protein